MNREIIHTPGEAGLSRAVTLLQDHLHQALPWIEKSFGLATDGHAVNREQLTVTVPEVYVGGGEYDPVLPDDRRISQLFFYQDGAEEVLEQVPYGDYRLCAPLSIVFWCDLDQLSGAMGFPTAYRYTDELKAQLLAALAQFPDFAAEAVDTKAERVWSGWNVGRGVLYFGDRKEYAIAQVGRHPQAGFRVRGTLAYAQPCGPGNSAFDYTSTHDAG